MTYDELVAAIFRDDAGGQLSEVLSRAPSRSLQLVDDLGARGLVAARLREHGRLDEIAREVRVAVDEEYLGNTVHALALERSLRELLAAFERGAIAIASLKGSSLLLEGVHRDLGSRWFHDIDVLTRAADRARVDEVLRADGYVPAGFGESPKHLPPYVKGRMFVEVHEFAYWNADGGRMDLDRWLKVEPSLAATAVHLLHHLHRSTPPDPSIALKTLWDFHELERAAFTPWREIRELALRAGLAGELDEIRAALATLRAGQPIDEPAGAILSACRVPDAETMRARELSYQARILREAPLWYAASHLRSLVFPARASLERRYRLKKGSPLAFAVYGVRPIELGVRAVAHGAKLALRGRLRKHERRSTEAERR